MSEPVKQPVTVYDLTRDYAAMIDSLRAENDALRRERDEYRSERNQLRAEMKCPECGCHSLTLTTDTTWNCDGCKYRWSVNSACELNAAEKERDTLDRFVNTVCYQLDRIAEHFDKDGNLLGDGRWRINEILKCVGVVRDAERELVKAEETEPTNQGTNP